MGLLTGLAYLVLFFLAQMAVLCAQMWASAGGANVATDEIVEGLLFASRERQSLTRSRSWA